MTRTCCEESSIGAIIPNFGVRSVFLSQTIDADSKAEQNQVNPVRNAEYNYGSTRFRYLHAHFSYLNNNYLTGGIPAQLANLTNLEIFCCL